nr:hypothetical protein [Xanthomonas sp. D-99]
MAFDINTALMESMFHKHKWHRRAGRSVSLTEVNSRLVRAVGGIKWDSSSQSECSGHNSEGFWVESWANLIEELSPHPLHLDACLPRPGFIRKSAV